MFYSFRSTKPLTLYSYIPLCTSSESKIKLLNYHDFLLFKRRAGFSLTSVYPLLNLTKSLFQDRILQKLLCYSMLYHKSFLWHRNEAFMWLYLMCFYDKEIIYLAQLQYCLFHSKTLNNVYLTVGVFESSLFVTTRSWSKCWAAFDVKWRVGEQFVN